MTLDSIERGRAAFLRHAWPEAVEALRSADSGTAMAADDLERLAEAEWWAGHPSAAVDAYERAFARYMDAAQATLAARVAMRLAYLAFRGLAGPVGAGWVARAEELLAPEPESAAHAWLAVFRLIAATVGGRLDDAMEHADQALEIARRHGDPSAYAMALSFQGMAEVARGRWREGVALSDQAAAAAMSGNLELRIASDIWCNTISTCRETGDLQRAGQWTDQAERWMTREAVGGYPGVCQVHRAELKMLRGDWPGAEQEARRACEELERYQLMDIVGFAHYEVGEVRMRMGDLPTATDELDRAYEYGHDAQPASALVQLATGDADEASHAIDRALASRSGSGGPMDMAGRARLLPAQVEIAIARHDIETARRAVEELETIASGLDRPWFTAAALAARGALLLQGGETSDAVEVLGRAWRLLLEVGLPYESARARSLYAQALWISGEPLAARQDLRAARSVFDRLGASLDVGRVDRLVAELDARSTAPAKRAARTFMFTDIVTSTDLVTLLGDDAWEDLLRWHDRELRSLFAAHRGEEVDHTGDGFFVAFASAMDGLECAVEIQRRLARHRRDHGFAPLVRIGIHTAEATRRGTNYSGQGVHVAARIGAAAEREQILISDAVLRDAGLVQFPLSAPRSVSLKGVREPVLVRDVDWH